MTITTRLNEVVPVRGVPDGKGSTDPTVRERWLEQRRGGITATEIRDWGNGAKRREIIIGKVRGGGEDLSHLPYVAHGNRREPVIAEWIERTYGITPCSDVYSHGENPRYLASPDGVTLDPFTGALEVGKGAALAEIKTSKHDLHPGRVEDGVLVEIQQGSKFDLSNYWTQMQWQMFVMNAERTLFVWEQHNDQVDPETGTFSPLGPPQTVWVMRDERAIERLVRMADRALEEIDAARLAAGGNELPPASELSTEDALLVAEYLDAVDAEAVAKAKKEDAWSKLQNKYTTEDQPDVKIDAGFATLSVSTSTRVVDKPDMDAARKRAPKLVAQYEALIQRYTKPVELPPTRRLTIRRKKGN